MMNVRSSPPPFPTNPTIGERFGNWVWNGARWVCSRSTGVNVIIQVFRNSAPYMPSPGLTTAMVECIGGGGGAGGVVNVEPTYIVGGGGGGSGGLPRISSSIPYSAPTRAIASVVVGEA